MPHEEVDDTGQVKERTAALLELGSVPTSILRRLVKMANKLEVPNPVNKKKLTAAFLFLSLLLLSCSTVERAWTNLIPEPHGPPSHIQEILVNQAAEEALQNDITNNQGFSTSALEGENTSVETNSYQPSNFIESW